MVYSGEESQMGTRLFQLSSMEQKREIISCEIQVTFPSIQWHICTCGVVVGVLPQSTLGKTAWVTTAIKIENWVKLLRTNQAPQTNTANDEADNHPGQVVTTELQKNSWNNAGKLRERTKEAQGQYTVCFHISWIFLCSFTDLGFFSIFFIKIILNSSLLSYSTWGHSLPISLLT